MVLSKTVAVIYSLRQYGSALVFPRDRIGMMICPTCIFLPLTQIDCDVQNDSHIYIINVPLSGFQSDKRYLQDTGLETSGTFSRLCFLAKLSRQELLLFPGQVI
jgi:hypothetical protein